MSRKPDAKTYSLVAFLRRLGVLSPVQDAAIVEAADSGRTTVDIALDAGVAPEDIERAKALQVSEAPGVALLETITDARVQTASMRASLGVLSEVATKIADKA